MKMYEALSMLCAAKDGVMPDLDQAIICYGMQSRKILRDIGLKKEEIEGEYPDEHIRHGIMMMFKDPDRFNRECQEAASWLISRS